jgi:spore germination protein GerM
MGNIQFSLLAISSEVFACACHTLWDNNGAVMGNVLIIPKLVLELLVIKTCN